MSEFSDIMNGLGSKAKAGVSGVFSKANVLPGKTWKGKGLGLLNIADTARTNYDTLRSDAPTSEKIAQVANRTAGLSWPVYLGEGLLGGAMTAISPEGRRTLANDGTAAYLKKVGSSLAGQGGNVYLDIAGAAKQWAPQMDPQAQQALINSQRLEAKNFRNTLGTLGKSAYAFDVTTGTPNTQISRTNPLTGETFTTEMQGKQVKMPDGSIGYQVYRVNPLNNQLISTIVSAADLSAMQGQGLLPTVQSADNSLIAALSGQAGASRRSAGASLRNQLDEIALRRRQAQEDTRVAEELARMQGAGDIMQGAVGAADTGLGGPGANIWAAQSYGQEQVATKTAEQNRQLKQILDQLALGEKQARRSYGATMGEIGSNLDLVRRQLGIGG